MQHIAIDLGSKESQICVREADGAIVAELRRPTVTLARFLERQPKSRVVVETCSEAFVVADAAAFYGHEVRVVPCSLVRALGVGAHGVKTDQRDARALSAASCRIDLPSVHIPTTMSRERKTLCGMRETLVQTRTKLINTVRSWLRTQTMRIPSGEASTLPRRVQASFERLGVLLPSYVVRQLRAIDALSEQIREADEELELAAQQDSTCVRLMTAPGVGPVTAIRFAATLDDAKRFGNAHAVQSYLGLTPGEQSSSDRKRRTAITKAGSSRMRWALGQASWVARRTHKDDPIVQWSLEVERRRGRKVAIVALTRKLAGVLYAIWRDGTTYESHHRSRRAA